MKRRVVLALAFACLVPAAQAQERMPAVRNVTLENGLRVILAPDSTAGGVDVAVWYGAGPRWERPGATGLSHLVERLQFRGSATVGDGEHRRQLQAAGATVNTNSTTDYSCLYETVAPEALGLALHLEAARMGGLSITPAAFEQERRASVDERHWLVDRQPLPRGLLSVIALLFPGHPYSTGVLGEEADLRRATARTAEAWARERFGPANALLTVVGRFDADATLQTIHEEFGKLPRRGSASSANPAEPRALARTRGFQPIAGSGAMIVCGWRGPGAADPDAPAGEILARLLAGSADTRVAQTLQTDKSAVTTVHGGWDARRDASVLWVAATMRPEADTAKVESDLLQAVQRIASQAPEVSEVERARKRVLSSVLFALQGPRGRAAALGDAVWLTGDAAGASKRIESLRRVTPADVQRIAQRVVRDDRAAICWLRGTGSAEGRP